MKVEITGKLRPGVTAKDITLSVIGATGTAGGTGYVIEYCGEAIRDLSMEGRMTVCNMAIEGGARAGLIAPDEKTFAYCQGRPHAPKGASWETALAYWKSLFSDEGAHFDRVIKLDAASLPPVVSWGTSPEDVITIDGTNIQEFELSALRKHIGVVLQDVFLFSSSIYQNITLGNPNITKEQVLAAAELVGASKFIEKLPGGLDYNVMVRGVTLSVGQRQLISFVRAMVYNPEILILDEATSSVDSETEELIQESIEKMMQGRTSIVIAHRLSTIQKADQILVLNKGEIVETGTHQSLLEKGGYYTQLHQMQLKMTAL